MNNKCIADNIINYCGGLDNIFNVTNCMTRVRITLKVYYRVDIDKLKKIDGILNVVEGETLQVIIGPGKSSKVANIINNLLNISRMKATYSTLKTGDSTLKTDEVLKNTKKQSYVKVILRHISHIFYPLLPPLIAAGILVGINSILINSAASFALQNEISSIGEQSSVQVVLEQWNLLKSHEFLELVTQALFDFLAIYVGVTSAKEFNGSMILGGVLGAITIMPLLSYFGQTPGQGGLIGVIFAVWLMCKLEKIIQHFIPDILDVILTPTIVLSIMSAVLIFIIIPIAGNCSDAILYGINGILNKESFAAGFLLAALTPFLVSLGLHHGTFLIHLEMIRSTGHAPLFAIQIMSNAGMVGAAVAVLLLTTDPRIKKIAKNAIPISILAVGEPTIFGVNIPAGFAFFTGSIGAGFGGIMIVFLDVTTNGIGAAGLSALPLIASGKYLQYIVSWLVGCVVAFLLTYTVGKISGYDKKKIE